MNFTKKGIYITLFAILYLIVAFSSLYHAIEFFGLANNSWMAVVLAFAFEIGQSTVLFSLLTSNKDRGKIMPWVLMTMFTLVQVLGNVYSSYKHIIQSSTKNLRFFKEPIFIWTDLPDDQATVIITYLVGGLLPIAALLLTSMVTNYLGDNEDKIIPNVNIKENILVPEITTENGPSAPIECKNKEEFLDTYNNGKESGINTKESESNNDNGECGMEPIEDKEFNENEITEDTQSENNELSSDTTSESIIENKESETKLNETQSGNEKDVLKNETKQKKSHFINL